MKNPYMSYPFRLSYPCTQELDIPTTLQLSLILMSYPHPLELFRTP
jgi:hypothetical protein